MKFGLAIASIYVLYVLGLRLVVGNAPFKEGGVSVAQIVAAYVFGGSAGGALVGWLSTLSRSRVGSMFVGTVAAIIVFAGIAIAAEGHPRRWTKIQYEAIGVLGVVFGIALGNVFHPTDRRTAIRADVSRLRIVNPPSVDDEA